MNLISRVDPFRWLCCATACGWAGGGDERKYGSTTTPSSQVQGYAQRDGGCQSLLDGVARSKVRKICDFGGEAWGAGPAGAGGNKFSVQHIYVDTLHSSTERRDAQYFRALDPD